MLRLIFLLLFSISGQLLLSQKDCGAYFPFKEGYTFEYLSYGKNGVKENSIQHQVKSVEQRDRATHLANVQLALNSARGKNLIQEEYQVWCEGAIIRIPVLAILAPQITASFRHMDIKVTGELFTLPNQMAIGDQLAPLQCHISAGENGSPILEMDLQLLNRQVEAKEWVSSPAGSYECWKVRATLDIKMLTHKRFEVVQWFASGKGMIRSETYNKRGQLENYMELGKLREN